MDKPVDIELLAAHVRPIVGDNGALHPRTVDRIRPLLEAHPAPVALHLMGEPTVRLLNGPMAQLMGVPTDGPVAVPMHLLSPINAMAYTAMRTLYGSGSEAPFAHLVCMGWGAAPSALLWQVRHVGRAVGQPVLLSALIPLVPALGHGLAAPDPCPAMLARLTVREREVLRLLANDMGNEEVARVLHISVPTLVSHKSRILKKLGSRHALGLIGRLMPGLGG